MLLGGLLRRLHLSLGLRLTLQLVLRYTGPLLYLGLRLGLRVQILSCVDGGVLRGRVRLRVCQRRGMNWLLKLMDLRLGLLRLLDLLRE